MLRLPSSSPAPLYRGRIERKGPRRLSRDEIVKIVWVGDCKPPHLSSNQNFRPGGYCMLSKVIR